MQGTCKAPPSELQRRRGVVRELRDRGTSPSTVARGRSWGGRSFGDKGRRYEVVWLASMGGEGAQVEELGAKL
jgi:hypothetical protein